MRGSLGLRRFGAAAVCALWLLPALQWPVAAAQWRASAADAKPPTAILIVAKDPLSDPDFGGSVVLVMNDLGPAPIGLIINRPTRVAVARLFPDLKRLGKLPDKVYFGGPVELDSVWFLFRAAAPPEHAVKACDGVYVSADRKLLLELLARDKPLQGLKIFIGHAGWAPGQLQAEIARGDWKLERADSNAIFNGKSDHPWPSSQGPSSRI
ncbi:MAG: YqgE/AlgH family protein [Steroidobacteraceae bacterium]